MTIGKIIIHMKDGSKRITEMEPEINYHICRNRWGNVEIIRENAVVEHIENQADVTIVQMEWN